MEERTRFVFCDNTHRDGGSPDSFTFNFADKQISCGEDEIITMELYDFFCQNNAGHGVNENNNKFLWNDTLIEIPVGSYTGTTLASTLQTEINSQLAARTKYVKKTNTYTQHINGVNITTDAAFEFGPRRDGVAAGSNIDYAANKVTVAFENNRFKIDVDLSTASSSDASHQIPPGFVGYSLFLTTHFEGYLFQFEKLNKDNPVVAVGFNLTELNGKSALHLGLHAYDPNLNFHTNAELKYNYFVICQDAANVPSNLENAGVEWSLPGTVNM